MEKEEKELLDRIANLIVEKELTPVSIFLLESIKPVSFLMSQLLVFFRPFATVFIRPDLYDRAVSILEDRKKIEYLLNLMEEKEESR